MMNLLQVKEYLDMQDWINAKSYEATFPHTYLNKNKCDDKDTFEHVIKFIRTHGTVKSFFKKQYVYLEIDGIEYWDMGRPAKSTIILNKAPINDNAKYRIPRPTVNMSKILRAKLLERDNYLELLLEKENRTEQEDKRISFLMNTTRRIDGGGKNIIDYFNQTIQYE